jgi:SOUL heme-binding protein
MSVKDDSSKSMAWPLEYAAPGKNSPPGNPKIGERMQDQRYLDRGCEVQTLPSQVIAVGCFSDASMEPVVRKADRLLREALQRDGLEVEPDSKSSVTFAQYDAIFSMGKRRGEVWIPLKDGGHPW